jgi:hypothetical protein
MVEDGALRRPRRVPAAQRGCADAFGPNSAARWYAGGDVAARHPYLFDSALP